MNAQNQNIGYSYAYEYMYSNASDTISRNKSYLLHRLIEFRISEVCQSVSWMLDIPSKSVGLPINESKGWNFYFTHAIFFSSKNPEFRTPRLDTNTNKFRLNVKKNVANSLQIQADNSWKNYNFTSF